MKTAISAFLAVLVISSIGIWSCAQQKCNSLARKNRDMETRYLKLEDDYRTVVAARENTRKKLAQMERKDQERTQERSQQSEEMQRLIQERDDLRQKLAARTNERDNVQGQLMQFSKDLQAFASRVDLAVNSQNTPPANGTPVAAPSPAKSN